MSTVPKVVPNALACTIAAPNALGLPWNLVNIPALNLDTSCKILLELKWVFVVCWA